MATYVTLYKFTDQGIKAIKDTTKRVEAARKAAKEVGSTLKEVLWLQGEYDIIVITEAEDEIAATAFGLNIAKQGNVRSTTLRAFTAAEMEKILAKVS